MIDLQEFKNMINYLKKERLIFNDADFASKVGKHRSYISEVKSKKRTITEQFVIQINEVFPIISLNWLLTGEGSMLQKDELEIEEYLRQGVPVYDIDATCGLEVRDFRDENIIGHIDLPNINKEVIIITARGESMNPIIKNGSMISVREIKNWDFIVYGQIYLVVTPEYRLLKYVRKHENKDYVLLKSANPDFDDIELSKGDIVKLLLVEDILNHIKLI